MLNIEFFCDELAVLLLVIQTVLDTNVSVGICCAF